jgi:hypothetical protein
MSSARYREARWLRAEVGAKTASTNRFGYEPGVSLCAARDRAVPQIGHCNYCPMLHGVSQLNYLRRPRASLGASRTDVRRPGERFRGT